MDLFISDFLFVEKWPICWFVGRAAPALHFDRQHAILASHAKNIVASINGSQLIQICQLVPVVCISATQNIKICRLVKNRTETQICN